MPGADRCQSRHRHGREVFRLPEARSFPIESGVRCAQGGPASSYTRRSPERFPAGSPVAHVQSLPHPPAGPIPAAARLQLRIACRISQPIEADQLRGAASAPRPGSPPGKAAAAATSGPGGRAWLAARGWRGSARSRKSRGNFPKKRKTRTTTEAKTRGRGERPEHRLACAGSDCEDPRARGGASAALVSSARAVSGSGRRCAPGCHQK
jgi:hypothetical protein